MRKIIVALGGVVWLASCASAPRISPAVRAELAPTGKLRAGINFGNGVVATRDPVTGQARGIAVEIARELARRTGLEIEWVLYDQARFVVDGVKAWDVAFLAIDPLRAEVVDFTAPYAEIEGTYLVPGGSPIRSVADVDRDGVRVAVVTRSNYDLFLSRNLKRAQLVRVETTQGSADAFAAGKADVLAAVKQRVNEAAAKIPGSRVLDGRFMTIRQAVCSPRGRDAAARYLREFVEDIKASGFVARAIAASGVGDAKVAPAASTDRAAR